jgi:hypothetical protein
MRPTAALLPALVLFVASLSLAQTSPVAGTADVPRVIRFSGTLAVDAGPVAVRFGLYREETSGEPLWAETLTLEVDAAGRYTAVLGLTTALPAELFVGGDARWLDVAAEGVAPQPRRPLVSVPYALKAGDAETIGGKPLSAFVLAGEKTGVGADGLTYVDKRVLASGLAPGGNGAAGGAGTPGYVGLFSDATTLVNSVIYQTPAGSIGVNTTAPLAGFHAVSGAAPTAYFDVYSNALVALPVVYRAARGTPFAPAAVQTNDILGGLAVRGYGATTWSAGRGQVMYKAAENWTDEAQGTYLQFTTTPIGTGTWAERMRIAPDGKVGIGTPAPAQMLSVAGTIESTSGGFKFPDGTTQTTAGSGYTAGPGLTLAGTQFGALFGGTGAAISVSRSDHDHGSTYVMLGGSYPDPPWLTSLAASKITGNLPVAQVAGAATLAANTFSATQTISRGNLALPATTAPDTGVITLNGQRLLHAFGATTWANLFVGQDSGSFSVSGTGGNVGVGPMVLASVTTGSTNTGVGSWSLASASVGEKNTAVGYGTLNSVISGTENTAVGASALQNSSGSGSTAIGSRALGANTSGYENTAVGVASLLLNTTGSYNVGVGAGSLRANTTGDQNVAVGYGAIGAQATGLGIVAVGFEALARNTGYGNSALGWLALRDGVTGSNNAAFGSSSLKANTADGNSAFGHSSLMSNTTGFQNSAFGYQALSANTTSGENSAFGYYALRSSTGGANTAMGAWALWRDTSGGGNSAFGDGSLATNTTGSYNDAFGVAALGGNTTGTHNSAFGTDALRSTTTGTANSAFGSAALTANTAAGSNSGFGYHTLFANVDGASNTAVGADALSVGTTGSNNVAVGAGSLRSAASSYNTAVGMSSMNDLTSGEANTSVGNLAGNYLTTGSYNTFLGYNARVGAGTPGLSYVTAIGAGAQVTQSNSLVLGGTGTYAVNVGINTASPDDRLQVVGDIKIGTSGTNGCIKNYAGTGILGTCSSDARLKTNIQPFASMLDRVARLQPVHFDWRANDFPEYRFGAGLNSGLVAQQVEQVFPEMVATDERGYKMVNYSELPYLTLQAVKELKAENDTLRARIDTKDEQLRQLAEQVAALTRAVAALGERRR